MSSMRRVTALGVAGVTFLVLAGAARATPTDLVQNGSFESTTGLTQSTQATSANLNAWQFSTCSAY